MPTPEQTIQLYLKLAQAHEKLGRQPERDRFLLLAADAAYSSGRREQAERLRSILLKHNPNHLLKPFATLAEAMLSEDIIAYLQQLRRSFPYEKAEHLAASLPAAVEGKGKPEPEAEEEFVLPLDSNPGKTNKMAGRPAAPAKAEAAKAERKETRPMTDSDRPPSPLPPLEPARRPAVPPQRSPAPNVFNLSPEDPPARARPPAAPPLPLPRLEPREEFAPGAWVGSFLFLVMLAVGIALLVYTIALPFVPLP